MEATRSSYISLCFSGFPKSPLMTSAFLSTLNVSSVAHKSMNKSKRKGTPSLHFHFFPSFFFLLNSNNGFHIVFYFRSNKKATKINPTDLTSLYKCVNYKNSTKINVVQSQIKLYRLTYKVFFSSPYIHIQLYYCPCFGYTYSHFKRGVLLR